MLNKIINDNTKVFKYLEKKLDLPKNSLQKERNLSSIQEWDSLAHLSLILIIEKEMKKQIDVEKLIKCKTPFDLVNFIRNIK